MYARYLEIHFIVPRDQRDIFTNGSASGNMTTKYKQGVEGNHHHVPECETLWLFSTIPEVGHLDSQRYRKDTSVAGGTGK